MATLTHKLADADREFRRAFEACAVAPADFGHEAHVRLAYAYLAELDVESAVQRMRHALLACLEYNDVPRSKFHETLTRSWILAARHFMDKASCASAADFIAKNPELLDSRIMLTHYSASVLFSAQAREGFVEPDLDPIPPRAGPGSDITQARFVLAVLDLKRSTDYYVTVLGLSIDFEAPGWSFLSRGNFRVMLGECTDAIPPGELGDHAYYGYITISDVDALYDEYRRSGVQFTQPLASKPWGMREFGIRTADGHRVMFGQELGPAVR